LVELALEGRIVPTYQFCILRPILPIKNAFGKYGQNMPKILLTQMSGLSLPCRLHQIFHARGKECSQDLLVAKACLWVQLKAYHCLLIQGK